MPISAVSKCTKVRVQHFLLDHHIGACEQCWRHREAEPLSRLKIDCQLNFRGLMNRKLSGLLALKYSPGLNASLPIGIRYAGSIAQQATSANKLTLDVACGKRMTRRQRDQVFPTGM